MATVEIEHFTKPKVCDRTHVPLAERRQLPPTTCHLKSIFTHHISPQVNCYPPHVISSQLTQREQVTNHTEWGHANTVGYDPFIKRQFATRD